MAYSQLFFSFSCRSLHLTMPELGLFTNKFLLAAIGISALLQLGAVLLPFAQPVFGVSGHSTIEWLLVLGLALVPVTVVEVAKLVMAALGWRHQANCNGGNP
jgi:Ca2+-transporting ATPase